MSTPNANAKVAIEIYVDDKGSVRIREFAGNTKNALDDIDQKNQGITGRIKTGWASVKGAWVEVMGVLMALRGAWELINSSAKAKQEEVAFSNLAASYGVSANKMIADLKRMSGETVADAELIKSAGTAMMMGLDPTSIVGLMKIARGTAKQTGQTITQAFNDITLASARQSKMILDNLGIILDVDKANKDYAESIGKTSAQLNDMERKQAFLNATLKAGDELLAKMGNQTDTAADKLERWKASAQNGMQVAGNLLLYVVMGVEMGFTGIGVVFNKVIEYYFKLESILAKTGSKVVGLGEKIPLVGRFFTKGRKALDSFSNGLKNVSDNAHLAANVGIKHLQETADTMSATWKAGGDAIGTYNKGLREQKAAAEALAEAQKKLEDQKKKFIEDEKKAANAQQSLIEEMYKEAGFGAEAYFQQESNKLIKKASDWEKAGADTLQVEEWLYEQLGKLSTEAWSKGEAAAGQYMDSLQAQSRTLVDEFNELQVQVTERLDEIGIKAEQLDGYNMHLSASFDGSAVSYGVDSLISKFQELQRASGVARAGSDAGTGESEQEKKYDPFNETTDEFIERVDNESSQGNQSGTTINNYNFNAKMSRSDVNNVIDEQRRRESRS
ncbi:MAG: hypothetical protein OEV73_05060 [Desulfobulbaceae bacterium]|nr:hypothetical protein [Desulfobulbaceae bacterium]